jgi:hypothetical protein
MKIVLNRFFVFSVLSVFSACGTQENGNDAHNSQLAAAKARPLDTSKVFDNRKYELISPTAEKLMASAFVWEKEQAWPSNAASFAQPAQCANNISQVYGFAGLGKYASAGVDQMVANIAAAGGKVISLSHNRDTMIKQLAGLFNGKIPTGSLIAGCLYSDCSGNAGDGHIAMVGDIDSAGALKAYHNNWYRPDNEGGVWKQHMIPLSWYNQGYRRKFMSTPWINIYRNPPRVGIPYDFTVDLPAIDDLDPTNYFVRIAIPVEILSELNSKKAKVLNAKGEQVSM